MSKNKKASDLNIPKEMVMIYKSKDMLSENKTLKFYFCIAHYFISFRINRVNRIEYKIDNSRQNLNLI
jgi:hypothetical protein